MAVERLAWGVGILGGEHRCGRVGAVNACQCPSVDPPLSTDEPESREPLEKEEEPGPEPPPVVPPEGEVRKSRKFSRLSCLRRRRHPPKAGDDSDLSEGFDSDSSHDSARASEGSDSGSDKSLEGGGTAFDAETDSEMNSQESRSDLEDMEDEDGTRSPALEPSRARSEAPESLNGPLGPSEASIASNLQAMSTQMFQTKRCFRLAPTFSNLLLQPTTEAPVSATLRRCVNGDVDKPSEPGMWASLHCPAGPHLCTVSTHLREAALFSEYFSSLPLLPCFRPLPVVWPRSFSLEIPSPAHLVILNSQLILWSYSPPIPTLPCGFGVFLPTQHCSNNFCAIPGAARAPGN